MRITNAVGMFCATAAMFLAGCATAPPTETARRSLEDDASVTLKRMETTDASLNSFLNRSYAYAVFPDVGKGGLIAGGAYGRGIVFRNNLAIGFSDLSQATFGLQAGGQSFAEIVVFEDQTSFDRFTSGKLEFAANVSAVALKKGEAESARYTNGVAVFVDPTGGLMLEAAIGGQQFTYQSNPGGPTRTTERTTETTVRQID